MKKIIYIILLLAMVGGVIYFATKDESEGVKGDTEYVTYENREHGLEFMYPKIWGEVILKEGNQTCPEEDTYRTQDTLHVYDREFSFDEIKLPGSESFIRSGIRTYEFDPNNLNGCGDDFLLKLWRGEIVPETFSSFRIFSLTIPSGLSGIYNEDASRLDTEYRVQYTFFKPSIGEQVYVLQPYVSFVPYAGSPELKEIEQRFYGDIKNYVYEGETAGPIRKYLEEFTKVANSLDSSTE